MLPYTLHITRKAVKNINLRIKRDRTIAVSAPLAMSDEALHSWIASKEKWIQRTLSAMPEMIPFSYTDGERHSLLGKPVTLQIQNDVPEGINETGATLCIDASVPPEKRAALFASFYARRLHSILEALIDAWAPVMGVSPSSTAIRPTISQWGSCNVHTKRLSFSLDLAAKPIPLIEAVVVHELCHLLERKHSPRFYHLVNTCLPDYKEKIKALASFPREFW